MNGWNGWMGVDDATENYRTKNPDGYIKVRPECVPRPDRFRVQMGILRVGHGYICVLN